MVILGCLLSRLRPTIILTRPATVTAQCLLLLRLHPTPTSNRRSPTTVRNPVAAPRLVPFTRTIRRWTHRLEHQRHRMLRTMLIVMVNQAFSHPLDLADHIWTAVCLRCR